MPFPDGVASPDGRLAFIELRTGGVRAIDLRTGDERWTSDVDARPLIVAGDRLIAEDRAASRDNVLQLIALDPDRQGAVDRRLDPIVLPDWVAVADPDQRFDYRVDAAGDDLSIEWSADSHYAGGAPPPASVLAQAERAGHGRLRVNLRTGRVSTEAGPAPPTRAAPVETGDNAARESPPADDVARLLPAGARSPAVVGDRLFYLVEAPHGRGGELALVSVDRRTGTPLWERQLPARARRAPPRRR
jgi:outer membrane protein assembly factor BamB